MILRDEIHDQFLHIFPQLLIGLSVFVVSILIAKVVSHLLARLVTIKENRYAELIAPFSHLSRSAILLLGAVTALGTMGVNVSALVAGLGLTGFALSFALKDVLSNTLAGILILFYRPFTLNQAITVDKYTGIVKNIDLRYTLLATDEVEILVPNATMLIKPVVIYLNGLPDPNKSILSDEEEEKKEEDPKAHLLFT